MHWKPASSFNLGLWLAVLLPGSHSTALPRQDSLQQCLSAVGVPLDAQGSQAWREDVAPFNERLPYQPAAIAVPRSIGHIQAAIFCARQAGVKVTPKSGGHSYASLGLGGENGHLVIELDRMDEVTLRQDNTAVIQAGARLGHIAAELWQQGRRAMPHGTCPG